MVAHGGYTFVNGVNNLFDQKDRVKTEDKSKSSQDKSPGQTSAGHPTDQRWFDYLKTQNHHVVGYVIMPNHIHVMI